MNERSYQLPPPPFVVSPPGPHWPLDRQLLDFGGGVSFTIKSSLEGVFIIGGTGSGKSSASGKAFIEAYLEANYGMLFLCPKASDRPFYEKLVRNCGRAKDLCVFEPRGRFCFSFLHHLSNHPKRGRRDVKNIVQFFERILENYAGGQGGGQEDEVFWATARRALMANLILALGGGGESYSIDDMNTFLRESPDSLEEVASRHWLGSSIFGPRLRSALAAAQGTPDVKTMEMVRNYWLVERPKQPSKTKNTVGMALSSMLDVFNDATARELFGGQTNLCPEHCLDGAVIIVDVAVKEYPGLGLLTQQIWKQSLQQAIEDRSDPEGPTRRPVALVMDEAQLFFHSSDGQYQATCRSSGGANLAITQNLPNIICRVPGAHADHVVHGWMGNFNTQVFHNQSEPTTCKAIAEALGRAKKFMVSQSKPSGSFFERLFGGGGSGNYSVSGEERYHVEPFELRALRCGGPENHGIVETYVLMNLPSGRATGRYFLPVVFHQQIESPPLPPPEIVPQGGMLQRVFRSFKNPFRRHLMTLPNLGSLPFGRLVKSRRRKSRLDELEKFHDDIVQWRKEGLDLRAIAAKIFARDRNLDIDHNVVSRYLIKHGMPTGRVRTQDAEPVNPVPTPQPRPTDTTRLPIAGMADFLSSKPKVESEDSHGHENS